MFLKEDDDRIPAMTKALADNLSGLLRQAVEDAQVIEKMPGYGLRMSSWQHTEGETCYVCMGGAVMARRLGVDRSLEVLCGGDVLDKFGSVVMDKMGAIDHMRRGEFIRAHGRITVGQPSEYQRAALEMATRCVGDGYDSDLRAPWSWYLAAATVLENAGL